MIRKTLGAVLVATGASMAPVAHAVDCQAGAVTATFADASTASFSSCAGASRGNTRNAGTLDYEASFGPDSLDGGYDFVAKANAGFSDGPFASVPGARSGTITMDYAIGGAFILGLKAGPHFAYYAFDGGSVGIVAISFDTLGVSVNRRGIGRDLSHATLYGEVPQVPEPGTYALMAAGLAAVGFMARRRRG